MTRLTVTPVQKPGWTALQCPLCPHTISWEMLAQHAADHRRGRYGARRVDVRLEVTMVVPDDSPESEVP